MQTSRRCDASFMHSKIEHQNEANAHLDDQIKRSQGRREGCGRATDLRDRARRRRIVKETSRRFRLRQCNIRSSNAIELYVSISETLGCHAENELGFEFLNSQYSVRVHQGREGGNFKQAINSNQACQTRACCEHNLEAGTPLEPELSSTRSSNLTVDVCFRAQRFRFSS